MTREQLQAQIATTCFAFRGYDQENLGRSAELLAHASYGPIVRRRLAEATAVAAEVLRRPVDLVRRVEEKRETTLADYGEACAIIIAMEIAQLDLLREFHGVDYHQAGLVYGYSLGEIGALAAGGVWSLPDAMHIPLALADDCIALAEGCTLGVLFSKIAELPLDAMHRLALEVSCEGKGVVGISAYLSPNTLLLMGQGDSLDRLLPRVAKLIDGPVHLRKNDDSWPPMHTPIAWQRNIPTRAAQMMLSLAGGFTKPSPPVLSLVTGQRSYTDHNARDLLYRWTDQPQRLWDAVQETLSSGMQRVIHVGPAPNIIPATFRRLQSNIAAQLAGSMSMRALSSMVSRPWLAAILPARAALLRAPEVEQINLEDWLLEQPV